MAVKLERFLNNPLLTPTTNWWECRGTFNSGVAYYKNKFYFLYRAVGQDGTSRFGLAISSDGEKIEERSTVAVFEPDHLNVYERCGCEDPRITYLDGVYYIVYTAASIYETSSTVVSDVAPWRTRVSLLKTTDFKTFSRQGLVFSDEVDDKDAALLPERIGGRYYMFHRRDLAIVLSSSVDLISWRSEGKILEPGHNGWQDDRVGIGSPPLKTELGWLLFYHARDHRGIYRLGAMIVETNNPKRIIAQLPEPILEPRKDFECVGIVPNVVFTCGVIEAHNDYLVYYGGADRVLAGAKINKITLISALRKLI